MTLLTAFEMALQCSNVVGIAAFDWVHHMQIKIWQNRWHCTAKFNCFSSFTVQKPFYTFYSAVQSTFIFYSHKIPCKVHNNLLDKVSKKRQQLNSQKPAKSLSYECCISLWMAMKLWFMLGVVNFLKLSQWAALVQTTWLIELFFFSYVFRVTSAHLIREFYNATKKPVYMPKHSQHFAKNTPADLCIQTIQ